MKLTKEQIVALAKIQTLVQKLAEQKNVKKVISDVQILTQDLQTKVQKVSADQAIKRYKNLAQKVVAAENELQKEVHKVVTQVKKSATEVEKNLAEYKQKAKLQRTKIEKALKAKAAKYGVKTAKAAKGKVKAARPAPKKARTKAKKK